MFQFALTTGVRGWMFQAHKPFIDERVVRRVSGTRAGTMVGSTLSGPLPGMALTPAMLLHLQVRPLHALPLFLSFFDSYADEPTSCRVQTPAAGAKMSRGEFVRLSRAVAHVRSRCDGDAATLCTLLHAQPSAAAINQAREWLAKEGKGGAAHVALDSVDTAAVARVLLDGLRQLDDPLLTHKLREAFAAAVNINDYKSRLYVLRLLLERLPEPNLKLVKDIVGLFASVVGDDASALDGTRLAPALGALGPVRHPVVCRWTMALPIAH